MDELVVPTWMNPVEPFDVNGDNVVTSLDALLGINLINDLAGQAGIEVTTDELALPDGTLVRPQSDLPGAARYFDVNGDGQVTPLDILHIINFLNSPLVMMQAVWMVEDGLPIVSAADGAAGEWAGDELPTSDLESSQLLVVSSDDDRLASGVTKRDQAIVELEDSGDLLDATLSEVLNELAPRTAERYSRNGRRSLFASLA